MFGEWYELRLPAEYGVIWKHLRAYGEFFEIQWNELASILYLRRKIRAFISDFQVAAPGREIGESESFFEPYPKYRRYII